MERGSHGQSGTLRMIAALPFRPVLRPMGIKTLNPITRRGEAGENGFRIAYTLALRPRPATGFQTIRITRKIRVYDQTVMASQLSVAGAGSACFRGLTFGFSQTHRLNAMLIDFDGLFHEPLRVIALLVGSNDPDILI
jgi:hypothetical protein